MTDREEITTPGKTPITQGRRIFLQRALACLVSLAGVQSGTEAAVVHKKRKRGHPGMIPILDTHQHLWDLSRFRLPWLDGGGPLAKNHLMVDYLVASAASNVVKTIYMEVDVEPSQHVKEAEYVIELCKDDDNPMVAAVIGGRPAEPGFKAYADRFAESPYVKGVRQVLPGGSGPKFWLDKMFIDNISYLGKLGLRYDLCIPPDALEDGARLVDACPGTRFILDHCGNADVQSTDRTVWQRGITDLAKRENVVCKVSGIVASAKPGAWNPADLAPIVHQCAVAFGHDRIMFGSDWPVCTRTATLGQWVDALKTITVDWNQHDRARLFYGNAARFYGLES